MHPPETARTIENRALAKAIESLLTAGLAAEALPLFRKFAADLLNPPAEPE